MSVFIIGGLVLINKSTNLTLNQNFNKRLIIFTTKKPKQDFPQTKITITTTVVKTNFQPLCCNVIRKSVTLYERVETYHVSTPYKTSKTSFLAHFSGLFVPKTPKQELFCT